MIEGIELQARLGAHIEQPGDAEQVRVQTQTGIQHQAAVGIEASVTIDIGLDTEELETDRHLHIDDFRSKEEAEAPFHLQGAEEGDGAFCAQ
ncbi:hypothetical protein DSCO28_34560 [Desulfosarcina ovata subsp. sediminis]|uniref:Uncharacterized protein n=1 Tax=Desulfosarcina ovata subsp. sediminis TaxID=885957 RepID=A0A5K7ZR75_9BACT|nr:hypothetical protein DSCO28_34560 [Desulfosarcina ovata subsp. sediminis]